jgi:hypothetical protein
MSILISVSESKYNGFTHPSAVTKLIGVPFITKIDTQGSDTLIVTDGKRTNDERIISGSVADTIALASGGYSDFVLSVTAKADSTNQGLSTPKVIGIKASSIVEIYEDPNTEGDAIDSIIRVRDAEQQEDIIYTVDETITEITALIPTRASKNGYKEYLALLTQTGTSAPTAVVIKNELSGTVVWSYANVGVYDGTLTGEFLANTTGIFITSLSGEIIGGGRNNDNKVRLRILDSGGNPIDAKLSDTLIRIVVKI